jgi:hypothetical protein
MKKNIIIALLMTTGTMNASEIGKVGVYLQLTDMLTPAFATMFISRGPTNQLIYEALSEKILVRQHLRITDYKVYVLTSRRDEMGVIYHKRREMENSTDLAKNAMEDDEFNFKDNLALFRR